ncbi:MAG: ATP-binding protein [Gammaproteobacteria bacterium]
MHETEDHPDTSMYEVSIRRLVWWPVLSLSLLVLLALAALIAQSWRGVARIEPARAHLVYLAQLQDAALSVEQALLKDLRANDDVTPANLVTMQSKLAVAKRSDSHLAPDTPQRLLRIERLLSRGGEPPVNVFWQTLAELRRALAAEWRAHDALMANVEQSVRRELVLAIGLLWVIPIAGGLGFFLLRHRIKHPLQNLSELLVRIGTGDYRPVPNNLVADASTMVQPLYRNYNALVSRIKTLEEEHRQRQKSLEQEVRRVTSELLQQSRELAQAERLAAVGAVSAGLAHDLRNPLAGIQMACGKVRRSLADPSQVERMNIVLDELNRITQLLGQQLISARHAPEPLTELGLDQNIGQLLSLARFQVPEGIGLSHTVSPPNLRCRLPESGLRHALLNLVLNAAQAIGDEPGTIRISAQGAGKKLILRVTDSGHGFPEAMLASGVRAFATHREGGTGLGLTMVRRFALELAGEMTLANTAPRGACVTLRLPCQSTLQETLTPARTQVHG